MGTISDSSFYSFLELLALESELTNSDLISLTLDQLNGIYGMRYGKEVFTKHLSYLQWKGFLILKEIKTSGEISGKDRVILLNTEIRYKLEHITFPLDSIFIFKIDTDKLGKLLDERHGEYSTTKRIGKKKEKIVIKEIDEKRAEIYKPNDNHTDHKYAISGKRKQVLFLIAGSDSPIQLPVIKKKTAQEKGIVSRSIASINRTVMNRVHVTKKLIEHISPNGGYQLNRDAFDIDIQ
jgi:hypothetical protein